MQDHVPSYLSYSGFFCSNCTNHERMQQPVPASSLWSRFTQFTDDFAPSSLASPSAHSSRSSVVSRRSYRYVPDVFFFFKRLSCDLQSFEEHLPCGEYHRVALRKERLLTTLSRLLSRSFYDKVSGRCWPLDCLNDFPCALCLPCCYLCLCAS